MATATSSAELTSIPTPRRSSAPENAAGLTATREPGSSASGSLDGSENATVGIPVAIWVVGAAASAAGLVLIVLWAIIGHRPRLNGRILIQREHSDD